MNTDMDTDTNDLDRLFAEARQDMSLPDALSRAILVDAAKVQTGFQAKLQVGCRDVAPDVAPPLGLWRQLLAALGGWPAMGGLATACAAGVWIGLAPPPFLPDLAQLAMGGASDIDLIEPYDLVMALSEEQ